MHSVSAMLKACKFMVDTKVITFPRVALVILPNEYDTTAFVTVVELKSQKSLS